MKEPNSIKDDVLEAIKWLEWQERKKRKEKSKANGRISNTKRN